MSHSMGQNWSDVKQLGNISLVGVLHYRVEFAVQVHRLLSNEKPDCICVELPAGLRNDLVTAIKKLPYHSVIIYETRDKQNGVLIVEGSDGVQEAVRSAMELNIPLRFVDPLPVRYPLFHDTLTDPYLVDTIGQARFLDLVKSTFPGSDDEENTTREQFMAARIQESSREFEKTVFVGGFGHIAGLLRLLESPQALPLMNTGINASISASLHPDSLKKGFCEIPKITEAFELWRMGEPETQLSNRHEMILSLMKESVEHFTRQTRQEIPEYVRSNWAKFLRKWLKFSGKLLPDLYQLVSTARGALDEDFAYHVHEYLSDYKWANDPMDPSSGPTG